LSAGVLVAIDLALTTIVYLAGRLESGRAPILDLWDLAKAVAIGALLVASARRARCGGLALFGIAFLFVGIADATNLHLTMAQSLIGLNPFQGLFNLHPTATEGLWELAVLSLISTAGLLLLMRFPGSWDRYPTVRRRLFALLVGLLFFAGVVDAIDHLTGIQGVWSLVEETGERLALSLALAYVVTVWRGLASSRPRW
jgi:hypothetical protein